MEAMPDLILASASPRRRELLSLMGLTFLIDAPDVDEHTVLGAREAVQELSRRKALAAAGHHPGEIVLAADTLVALNDVPFGKPQDEEDAARMLRSLSDVWHQVYTGVCVVSRKGEVFSGLDTSEVHFQAMTEGEIRAYIRSGEPMDKAGAYALQGMGGMFISEVRGTPSGIIGLPLPLTRELLARCGLHLPITV